MPGVPFRGTATTIVHVSSGHNSMQPCESNKNREENAPVMRAHIEWGNKLRLSSGELKGL